MPFSGLLTSRHSSCLRRALFPLGHRRRLLFRLIRLRWHEENGLGKKLSAVFIQLFKFQPLATVRLSANSGRDGKRVLFIEDILPEPALGAGYPRSFALIGSLVSMGFRVTVLPVLQRPDFADIASRLASLGVNYYYLDSESGELPVVDILLSERETIDIVCICRPHNMQPLGRVVRRYFPRAILLYDAEAFYANREIAFAELTCPAKLTSAAKERLLFREARLSRQADCVIAVSASEAAQFKSHVVVPVCVIAHSIHLSATAMPFASRSGILLVGGIAGPTNPNQDALEFTLREIVPALRVQSDEIVITVVGPGCLESAYPDAPEGVHFMGSQPHLQPFYEQNRVFLAPTRYSAGIPLKVIEAAAHGIPCVVSTHLHERLGWDSGVDYLQGKTAKEMAECCLQLHSDQQLWEKIRETSTKKIEAKFSPMAFKDSLTKALSRAGVII